MILYDVLRVAQNATPDEIKAAYRARSKTMHPDAGGSARDFETLRRAYDETGTWQPTQADQAEQQIAAIVADLLEHALMLTAEPGRVDVANAMRAAVAKRLEELAGTSHQLERAKARAADMRARFARVDGGDDLVDRMLRLAQTRCDQGLADNRRRVELHKRVLTILAGYTYRQDETPSSAAYEAYVRGREQQARQGLWGTIFG